MTPCIPDNGTETPFAVTTQFPEHLPRYSQQPTLVSGCDGLPAEVTIGCGGGTHDEPRMASNGETYTPSKPGRVAPPVTDKTQGWGNFFKFAAHDDTPSLNAWAGDVSAMVGDSLHNPIINRTKV